MCLYSIFWTMWEKKNLAPYAVTSDDAWYTTRSKNDTQRHAFDGHGSRSRYRTAFEIDKDRIAKSQAFRRLEYKTQIFVTHEGDNYRTRLTHSLEVSEVARHIARALRLNEHLVEAIALGHDLGHAPYGHTGENTINKWLAEQEPYNKKYYFSHNQQSVEVVESLEPGYDWDIREGKQFGKGLNITRAVKEGILAHASFSYRGVIHQDKVFDKFNRDEPILAASKRMKKKELFFPGTLEAQVVRVSDDIAQRISDLEDGLRSNVLKKDHIIEAIIKSFGKVRDFIFPDGVNIDSNKIHIHHSEGSRKSKKEVENSQDIIINPGHKAKIPKLLLSQIVELLDKKSDYEDSKEYIDYRELPNRFQISDQEKFKDAALIAFLLHMWRDAEVLSNLDGDEQESHRTRILKYLKLYLRIKNRDNKISAYNLIGFLRGILLANVIEHSFWNLHYCLNKDFSGFLNDEIKDEPHSKRDEACNYHLVFAVVDGLIETDENGRGINFIKAEEGKKLYHYEFDKSDEMHNFVKENLEKILETNGASLLNSKGRHKFLKKIDWLNKSEKPRETERVLITKADGETLWVPIEKIRIYYTGYRELCPGPREGERCHYIANKNNAGNDCRDKKCPFLSDIKYPDINRLVKLHKYAKLIDDGLREIVTERIHNSTKVARMIVMGEKIMELLLNEYLRNPRIMNQRVWLNIDKYPEAHSVGNNLDDWIRRTIHDKEKSVFPSKAYNEITEMAISEEKNETLRNGRYSLIRMIISHVAGMTDRYLKNEYNRLTQGGREVEIPDESYFFM